VITLEQLQAGIVLPIDKPRQWTSFQAVNKLKAVVRNTYGLKKFKIGHAGTLDPLATGLLLVCIGKATKTIPQLQDGDKVYTGTFVFGATTPCFDLERPIDNYYPYEHITPALLEQTLPRFTGTIMQVPPMFSAVKIDGQRAYEYARADDPTVTIQPKPVNIYSFEITAFREGEQTTSSQDILKSRSPEVCESMSLGVAESQSLKDSKTPQTQLYKNPLGEVPAHLPQADFRIHCGKGTYIRSIARDLGVALGSGAFLSALRREQIGDYSVSDALQLDEVADYLTK
jgi:tRNA pseudouridine55 synthase